YLDSGAPPPPFSAGSESHHHAAPDCFHPNQAQENDSIVVDKSVQDQEIFEEPLEQEQYILMVRRSGGNTAARSMPSPCALFK
ncbi:hypothetical protein E2562_022847, partial [Oryza meyeriana var. granulata]